MHTYTFYFKFNVTQLVLYLKFYCSNGILYSKFYSLKQPGTQFVIKGAILGLRSYATILEVPILATTSMTVEWTGKVYRAFLFSQK